MTRQTALTAIVLASSALIAQAQTGMSTEGAMPQSRAASGSASGAHSGNKAGKPDADKMAAPQGTSKKPAKQGAQSGGASAPM